MHSYIQTINEHPVFGPLLPTHLCVTHHVSLSLTFQNGVIPQRERPSAGGGGA